MVLSKLKDGLIVSCQPVAGGAMDDPQIVAAFARAAMDGGAVGLRIEGIANLRAVRAVTEAPIIGLVKIDLADSPVIITPLLSLIKDLLDEGSDIVAIDATGRPRPEPLAALIAAITGGGAIAMADCATVADGRRARDLGCEVLGSTLSGYTGGAVPMGPDLDLVAALRETGGFVIAEGRYRGPDEAAAAIRAGADAVVAGSAITRPEHVTDWFATAVAKARSHPAIQ